MYIDENSVKVNNISMGQYITQAEFSYNKLWASDTGRSLSGKMTGTLIGIFPKITLQFRPLTKAEINTLSKIFDSANQTVQYYDPNKNATVTMTTYSGDWTLTNRNLQKNEGFSISLISVDKRR